MYFRMRWANGLSGVKLCEADGRCITKWFRIIRCAASNFLWIRTLWRFLVRRVGTASATANFQVRAFGRYRQPGKLSCVRGELRSGAYMRNLPGPEDLL